MLNFRDFIGESFDSKPYPLKMVQSLGMNRETLFNASTKAGELMVIIGRATGVRSKGFAYSVDFAIDGEYFEMTGANEPFKILATVVAGIKKFMALHRKELGEDPATFVISTNKDIETDTEYNRHRVYVRMIDRFAGNIGYKVAKTYEDTTYHQMKIILHRK